MDELEMSFIIYDGRRFKHPIKAAMLTVFFLLSLWGLNQILDQQALFAEEEEHLMTLKSELDKLQKKERTQPSHHTGNDSAMVFDLMNQVVVYSNEKVRLTKLDFRKTTNQLDMSGDVQSLEELAQFKDWLVAFPQIKHIEVISNAYLTEQNKYRYNFFVKVML
ncbi:hypothetical protein GCM10027155_03330 [Acinetobacter apis]